MPYRLSGSSSRRFLRLLACLLLTVSTSVESQLATRPAAPQLAPETKPTGCETNTAVLDALAQRTDPEELIIVIARLGNGESRRDLNRRRLHNVREYLTGNLTHVSVRRKPETLILAEGENAKGYGSIEFYVKGKLFHHLALWRGADLIVSNCGYEPPETFCYSENKNLYPCRDKKD